MERPRLLACVSDLRRNVILQILANARERGPRCDAVSAQLVGVADTRKHQKLRRVNDAAAQDHFLIRVRSDGPAALGIFDADRAFAVEYKLRHQRIGLDREIRATKGRTQVSISRAAAAAIAHGHLPGTEAFLLCAIVIGRGLVSGSLAGRGKCVDQWIGKTGCLRRERAIAATEKTWATFPGFLPPEVRKNVAIGPAGQSGRSPAVVVAAVAARI